MVERISKLIQETQHEPFGGMGKPEALYRVVNHALEIVQLRFHY
jgi:Txe/YoeB family toxin of Txe-Axe toxin-antitoxin module